MTFEFKFEDRAAQPALTIREETSMAQLPAFFERAFGGVMGHLAKTGQDAAGPPFALYHTQDMNLFDVEAGFPLAKPAESSGHFIASMIPGGRACTTVLNGPYDKLPEAWDAITAHMKEQGLESESYGIEFYLNDPTTVPPEEIQTLIVLPVKA